MNNAHVPPVNARYGAPMGRPDKAQDTGLRMHLRRVRINSGGYDDGGAYWGLGAPLWAYDDGENDWSYLRARTRDDAKAKILERFPDAKFYR